MTKAKSYIPEGFHTVTPFLMVDGADELIEFMTNGLDGQKIYEMRGEDKKISHASVKIGNSIIMLGDTMGDMKPEPQFYGDRAGSVKDKWGNTWWIATQIEAVDNKELQRRAKEAYKNGERKFLLTKRECKVNCVKVEKIPTLIQHEKERRIEC